MAAGIDPGIGGAGEWAVAALLLLAGAVPLGGLAARIVRYHRTPVVLPVALTPAPTTRAGAALRIGREVTLFASLWGADKALWVAAMAFHLGLLLVLLRHLRYVVAEPPLWLVALQPAGELGGLAMVAGLVLLLARRLLLPRVRRISRPTDYAWLVLLLALGGSGLATRHLWHTDILALKDFLAGIWRLAPTPLPGEPLLLLHLLLAAALLILLPFSKLLHIPGVLWSPSRARPDDARPIRGDRADG